MNRKREKSKETFTYRKNNDIHSLNDNQKIINNKSRGKSENKAKYNIKNDNDNYNDYYYDNEIMKEHYKEQKPIITNTFSGNVLNNNWIKKERNKNNENNDIKIYNDNFPSSPNDILLTQELESQINKKKV